MGQLYFRRAVPEALRSAFEGKAVHKGSLRTKDFAEAKVASPGRTPRSRRGWRRHAPSRRGHPHPHPGRAASPLVRGPHHRQGSVGSSTACRDLPDARRRRRFLSSIHEQIYPPRSPAHRSTPKGSGPSLTRSTSMPSSSMPTAATSSGPTLTGSDAAGMSPETNGASASTV